MLRNLIFTVALSSLLILCIAFIFNLFYRHRTAIVFVVLGAVGSLSLLALALFDIWS